MLLSISTLDKTLFGWEMFGHSLLFDLIIGLLTELDLNYWGWRNNYFYGNWWNNYYGWNNRRWSSQWGNHYGWNNFYNRYRGTNVAYHTGGRNGRVDTYINYRRGTLRKF